LFDFSSQIHLKIVFSLFQGAKVIQKRPNFQGIVTSFSAI
jgi:hypothetical protein